MNIITLITSVFCISDDWLKGQKVWQRGPEPSLGDNDVLTTEIVGEFLGYDADEALYE